MSEFFLIILNIHNFWKISENENIFKSQFVELRVFFLRSQKVSIRRKPIKKTGRAHRPSFGPARVCQLCVQARSRVSRLMHKTMVLRPSTHAWAWGSARRVRSEWLACLRARLNRKSQLPARDTPGIQNMMAHASLFIIIIISFCKPRDDQRTWTRMVR